MKSALEKKLDMVGAGTLIHYLMQKCYTVVLVNPHHTYYADYIVIPMFMAKPY